MAFLKFTVFFCCRLPQGLRAALLYHHGPTRVLQALLYGKQGKSGANIARDDLAGLGLKWFKSTNDLYFQSEYAYEYAEFRNLIPEYYKETTIFTSLNTSTFGFFPRFQQSTTKHLLTLERF